MSGSSGWTLDHLTSMREAAAAGLSEVTFANGRRVKYHDLSALMAAIQIVEADLIARGIIQPAGGVAGPVYTYFERC